MLFVMCKNFQSFFIYYVVILVNTLSVISLLFIYRLKKYHKEEWSNIAKNKNIISTLTGFSSSVRIIKHVIVFECLKLNDRI